MTTNQTIDGVPRELLERIAGKQSQTPHWDALDEDRISATAELRALLDAPAAENIIDIDAVCWSEILRAASESSWMPLEYMRNDWVDDVCRFLREGLPAQPQGEPVAYRCRHSATEPWFFSDKPGYWEWQALYAEQPAPVAVVMTGRRPIPAGIESLAKQVYQSWESQPGFIPWVEGGNSLKQDEARQIASRVFELALANQVGD